MSACARHECWARVKAQVVEGEVVLVNYLYRHSGQIISMSRGIFIEIVLICKNRHLTRGEAAQDLSASDHVLYIPVQQGCANYMT